MRSAVIGVAISSLAGMEKSRHTPASLLLPGKEPKYSQQSTLQPTKLPVLSVPAAEGSWRGSGDTAQRDAAGAPKMRCTQIV